MGNIKKHTSTINWKSRISNTFTIRKISWLNGQERNRYVELKEFFKYDQNGNIIEFTEQRNGQMSKTTYHDHNEFGIAETVKRYHDNGQVSHIDKLKFIYW